MERGWIAIVALLGALPSPLFIIMGRGLPWLSLARSGNIERAQ